jgi:hypothetical protein
MKLDTTMFKHGIQKPNFKGFMANSAQANWNVVKIIYDFKDMIVKMVDREQTCLFQRTQLLDRHTKQLIKPQFQD